MFCGDIPNAKVSVLSPHTAHSPRYNYWYLSAYFIGSVKGSSQPVHTPSLARACAAHTH